MTDRVLRNVSPLKHDISGWGLSMGLSSKEQHRWQWTRKPLAYRVYTIATVGETGYGCHTFYITDVFRNIVIIADIRLLLCLNIVSCAHINMQIVIFIRNNLF